MPENAGGNYKWLVLLTVSIGVFMCTMDMTIVNVSFPRLTRVFDTEASVVMWVTAIYLLVCSSLMLTFGRIGDAFGRKKVYNLGYGLFAVGLLVCSLSQGIGLLIAGRIVQAIGAAMVIGLGNAIVATAFPTNERGKAMGMLGTMVAGGSLTGPAIGGLLLDALDWRAIFYVRIPLAILGLVMSRIVLREQMDSVPRMKFDFGGAAALFGSLSCLLLFFNFGGRSGFTSLPAPAMGAVALGLLALFIVLEKRTDQGIVDLSLFKSRQFTGGNTSLVILFFSLTSMTFLVPFYLIDGLGRSASEAGILIAVMPLCTLIVAPFAGMLSDRIGARLLCTTGIAVVGLGIFLLSGLGADASTTDILTRLACIGLGQGMFISPNASSILSSVSRDRLNTASAMIATARQIGMSSGVAIAGTIFVSRQSFHAVQLAGDSLASAIAQKLSVIGGVQDTLIIAAIMCGAGVVASLARGNRRPT